MERWARRLVRWVLGGFALLGVAALAAVMALTRTAAGQRFVLERTLARLEGAVRGELSVGGISSPGLLGQVTLHAVRIADQAGRPLLWADSIRARYGLVSLLRGQIVVTELSVWGGDVTVERLPGEESWNAERIFAPLLEREGPGPAPSRRRIALHGVRLHHTNVTVRLPLDSAARPGAGAGVESGTDGDGRFRALRFTGIEAVAPDFVIRTRDGAAPRITLAEVALLADVWRKPFRIERVRGEVEIRDTAVVFDVTELALPGSRLNGRGAVAWGGGEHLRVAAEFAASRLDLEDLRWAEPRLPEGTGRLAGRFEMRGETVRFQAREADLVLGTSRVRGAAGIVAAGGELRLDGMELHLAPLELAVLEPFLVRALPVEGAVAGELRADGSLRALAVDGRLTLTPRGEAGPSTVRARGTLRLAEPYGATDFFAVVAPLDLGTLAALDPRVKLRGPASARLTATGRLDDGIRLTALLTHTPRELPPSRVEVEGVVRSGSPGPVVDLAMNVQPLSLTALAGFYPGLPLGGAIRGPIRVRGPVGDLRVGAELETPAGALAFEAQLDGRHPGRRYLVTGAVRRFRLSEMAPRLRASTVTASFRIEGSGLALDSLRAAAVASLSRSRIEELEVDTAHVALRVEEGVAVLDTAYAVTRVASLEAGGRIALTAATASAGELRVRIASDSLEHLHPFLFGDSVIVQDTLSGIERSALEMRGIDPDTLARGLARRVAGRLRAELSLRGNVHALEAEGRAELRAARYGSESARRAAVDFHVEALPALHGPAALRFEADTLEVGGRTFRHVTGTLDFRRPSGELALVVTRDANEEYRLGADFEADSARLALAVSELTLRFGDAAWRLDGPARLVRDERGVEVRGLRLAGPESRSVRVAADGMLPSRGRADFLLEIERLPLARVARLAQVEERGIGGVASLRVEVGGTAASPEMHASVAGRDVSFEGVELSTVDGRLDYGGRRLTGELQATVGGRRVFTATGTLPLDLAFTAVRDRIPAEPVDIIIAADSFPAATVLSFVQGFENVTGAIGGAIHVGGTARALAYDGEMRLAGGGARLDAVGVRYSDVEGTFRLSPDRRVHVNAQVRSRGRAGVTGTVRLESLRDPEFDLDMALAGFQGVDRVDMTAILGGRLALRGSYRRPVVTGSLLVERGTLWLHEFQRGREVVDLSDPSLFAVVDTTLVTGRAVISESQNPFLQNLRVTVDLAVRRDTWLRSPEMNVEIAGDLAVSYDRTTRHLALVGELQAARGSYTAFGRHFRVAAGTIEFVGSPEVDPNLDIQAVYRLRTAEGEPLNIMATLGGTLREPRLMLSSDAQPPISQSDLVSYLIFGRPTYALASGESSVLGHTLSTSLLGAAAGAAVSTGLGAAASQIEALLVQDFGIDYFSITPAIDAPGTAPQGGVAGAFGSAQIELGQYVSQDVFLVLLYRLGTLSQSRTPGARIEWRFADFWTAEMFAEDRFSRMPLSGFGELGFRLSKVLGIFVYRDWGY